MIFPVGTIPRTGPVWNGREENEIPVTVTVEDGTVAAFRLPISVAPLAGLSSLLEVAYGTGLRMVQRGDFLIIVKEEE